MNAVTAVSGAISTSFTYDANGNQTSGLGRRISYTSYNKPSSITQGARTIDARIKLTVRQTLFTLRKLLGDPGPLRLVGETVALDPLLVEADVAAFVRSVAALRLSPPASLT